MERGDDEHDTGDLRHHQPVRWRLRRVEERVGLLDVENVLDAESRMFEQVGGLVVDLERVLVVEEVEIERFRHTAHCITNDYGPYTAAP
jgi:hypothetical protein